MPPPPPKGLPVLWAQHAAGRKNIGDVHMFQKSASLCRFYLEKLTYPGDVVLDLFGCSGDMCIAAEQSDRRWIYCELDQENFEWGAGRIIDAVRNKPKPRWRGLGLPCSPPYLRSLGSPWRRSPQGCSDPHAALNHHLDYGHLRPFLPGAGRRDSSSASRHDQAACRPSAHHSHLGRKPVPVGVTRRDCTKSAT